MKTSYFFFQPVLESTQSGNNRELLEQSQDLYDEGKHLEAFHSLLDYLSPEIRTKYGNDTGTEFNIPHGSILVKISIDNQRFSVSADFLKVPEKGRVAMLRQITELNNRELMLAKFIKQNDSLKMVYECPVSQTNPYKIFFLLQNICIIGDKYDDEFCNKFGATRCYEPLTTPYSVDEKERVYQSIVSIVNDSINRIDEYYAQREYAMAWNVMITAMYRISYVAAPQGQLLNELDRIVDSLDDDSKTVEQEIAEGKAFLQKLGNMPREQVEADLYFVETLTPTKRRSSLRNVQENFVHVFEQVTEAIQNKQYERAAIRMYYKLYMAYYYNNMQDDINAIIVKALKETSEKPWEEAAATLYDAMDKIMEGELDATPEFPTDMSSMLGAGMQDMMQNLGEQMQGMMQNINEVQQQNTDLQAAMSEALARGDMQEYMRLVQEYQQKMMQQMFSGK